MFYRRGPKINILNNPCSAPRCARSSHFATRTANALLTPPCRAIKRRALALQLAEVSSDAVQRGGRGAQHGPLTGGTALKISPTTYLKLFSKSAWKISLPIMILLSQYSFNVLKHTLKWLIRKCFKMGRHTEDVIATPCLEWKLCRLPLLKYLT